MLAASNPGWANSAMAASRIAARVSIERCCSALLRGRSRRAAVSLVFFAISLSINIAPNRTPSQVSRQIAGRLVGHLHDGAESERDAHRQCRIFESFRAAVAKAHGMTFVSPP